MPPKRGAVTRYRSSPALNKAKLELAKYRSKLSAMRRSNKNGKPMSPPEAFKCAAVTAGGGALGGVVSVSYPEVAGFDSRMVAGGLMVLGGAYTSGEMSNLAVGVGAGMLASWAGEQSADFWAGMNSDASGGS
jgi:hypothetical protein